MGVLHRLVSFLRAQGRVGNEARVARITGYDAGSGLERDYLTPKDCRSATRKSGHLAFEITEPGFYEYRAFGTFKMPAMKLAEIGGVSGFVRVDDRGSRDVTEAQVVRYFRDAAARQGLGAS